MARIYPDNFQAIGNTPLIRLNHVTKGAKATVVAKVEGRNPAYSVKCPIGANRIWDAEERGVLTPGVEIVEPTSGNTGVALAKLAGDLLKPGPHKIQGIGGCRGGPSCTPTRS